MIGGSSDPLERDEWADVCVGIVACYPGHKGRIEPADFEPWYDRIASIPGDVVLEACDRATAHTKFPPSLSDLLGRVDEVRMERRRRTADTETAAAKRRDDADWKARSTSLASYLARGCPGDPLIDDRTGEERVALVARMMGRGIIPGTATLRGESRDAVAARERLAAYCNAADLERLAAADPLGKDRIDVGLARVGGPREEWRRDA